MKRIDQYTKEKVIAKLIGIPILYNEAEYRDCFHCGKLTYGRVNICTICWRKLRQKNPKISGIKEMIDIIKNNGVDENVSV